ncbi:uncharacterized protein B0H18DRAFT_50125 [Fomitopsis serialis]|uniref:uncharacterized protein n=1 Tax=Fomitopsis serialis TaxID=139415 RepID=UPI002008CFB9|nr:uncharacterized protein B0H18DRAFT_50125 [Neoantrodia serialis]KAH9932201.1 hypothetical protein B0H18DRAFT_50125 [Neoantrodia serialis]
MSCNIHPNIGVFLHAHWETAGYVPMRCSCPAIVLRAYGVATQRGQSQWQNVGIPVAESSSAGISSVFRSEVLNVTGVGEFCVYAAYASCGGGFAGSGLPHPSQVSGADARRMQSAAADAPETEVPSVVVGQYTGPLEAAQEARTAVHANATIGDLRSQTTLHATGDVLNTMGEPQAIPEGQATLNLRDSGGNGTVQQPADNTPADPRDTVVCMELKDGMACNKTFPSRTSLGRHVRNVHQQPFPWACSKCDKTFSRKDALKRHNERVVCSTAYPGGVRHGHSNAHNFGIPFSPQVVAE